MPRVKGGVKARRRHNKYMKLAKGFRGAKGTVYRQAREAVERSLAFAYGDRKRKKRDFRKLWIIRINAAAREHGMSYSRLINGLAKAEVEIDRKMLAEMAVSDSATFAKLVETARAHC